MAKKNDTANEANVIALKPINVKRGIVCIRGSSDLVLNKMNASNTRQLIAPDRKAQAVWEAQHKNVWEDIITAIHWRDPLPLKGDNSDGLATNRECSAEMMEWLLANNAPCITAFGLKQSWGQAVIRQEIDKFRTKFDSAVNIVSPGGLVPVKFAEWRIDERLMAPKKGAPITTRLNHFVGWSAEVPIEFTENVFSISSIATAICYAGFSIGIGSGRTSGYGRYTIGDARG